MRRGEPHSSRNHRHIIACRAALTFIRYSQAAPSPMASAMAGVPASNLQAGGRKVQSHALLQ